MGKLGVYLILFLAVAGCSQSTGGTGFDRTLKAMEGTSEAQLITTMRRPPDSSVESEPGVKVLQWRRDQTVKYSGSAGSAMVVGGQFYYLPGASPREEREQCFVEWTVVKGVATTYRWEGQCRS